MKRAASAEADDGGRSAKKNINDGTPAGWSVESWQEKPIRQQPAYADDAAVSSALSTLQSLPPLVSPGEVDELLHQLSEAAQGKRFLLQGGDCAELFSYCQAEPIESKLRILLQMSIVLTFGARTPIVRIGRMAGQYGKPRSKPTEMVNGAEVKSYKGDNVNGYGVAEREPDPERLVQAYFRSAATLNYVRALIAGGFADLRQASVWAKDTAEGVSESATESAYADMVTRMKDAVSFAQVINAAEQHEMQTCDFFVSHEGLLLNYEAALTRKRTTPASHLTALRNSPHYNLGAHFLWIGDRTRQLDGAHIEYFRGIANPIGIKVGPTMKGDELVELIRSLNPNHISGKITLITRFGVSKVEDHLEPLIRAVQSAQLTVVWCCDPMHGNTETTASGLKTRNFASILEELNITFKVHERCGQVLNGVHFEMTGEHVTECVGGTAAISEDDLSRNYATYCDPRLNREQSLEMALLISERYRDEREGTRAPSPR